MPGLRVQMPEAGGAQARERIKKARLPYGDVLPVVEISFNKQGRDFDAIVCDFAAFDEVKNSEQQERLVWRGRVARAINAQAFDLPPPIIRLSSSGCSSRSETWAIAFAV